MLLTGSLRAGLWTSGLVGRISHIFLVVNDFALRHAFLQLVAIIRLFLQGSRVDKRQLSQGFQRNQRLQPFRGHPTETWVNAQTANMEKKKLDKSKQIKAVQQRYRRLQRTQFPKGRGP